jgi:peptidoglycan/LPS O-acetylase OafA/YrhL
MSTALLARSAKRDPSGRVKPTPHAKPDRQARWSALDGVRALAVIGVILYHAGVRWVPGGLLGVDVFFVLSGYLITSLLLREVRDGGRVDLRAFWARRARRLLPALLLVLLAVMLWAAVDRSLDIHSIRLDVTSALLYAANWRFAFSHQGYFSSAAAPSPVLHLWSLGVEEQFYLLWPLLVAGVVAFARLGPRLVRLVTRREAIEPTGSGRRSVFALAVLGGGASTAWLIYGALHGTDASRLYYGTDTRALALLTGAALAACLPLPRSPQAVRTNIHVVRRWSLVGTLALGGLGYIFVTISGQDRLLYRGGFLVVAVLVALVIASLIRAPRGPVSRLLGLAPVAHIGRISYGLYLWHWPVILFFNGARTGLIGPALLCTRIGISLALAELSYWLMERPILAGFMPGRRLAAVGLVGVIMLAGIAGPWSVLPRASGANDANFASKLDAMAQKQNAETQRLIRQRVTLPKKPVPTPAPPPVYSKTPGQLPNGVPYVPPNPVPAEPLNVLLVGDSTAWSANLALQDRAYAWKINLINAARIGCGIAPGAGAGDGDQAPVKYGECWNWPQEWQQTVAVQRPDVSLVVLGHWEVVNRNVNGKVVHIGQPGYDNLLKAQFEKAVQVLGSAGGKVALATAPCYLRPERPDGTYWPQDDCRRVQDFNKIVWAVAAEHPLNVVVLDLYQFFSPDGKWHLDIGGHQVRDSDGIHFNIDGGEYLAPVFLGGLRELMGLPLIPQNPPAIKVTAATGG